VAWAAVEIIQMIWMHSENQKIVPSLSYWSLLKLCACGLGGVAIFLPIQQTLASSMLPRFALLLVVLAGGLVVCTSLIFRLGDAVDQIALGLGLTSRGQGA
jgi:hypothetical protein